MLYLQFSINNFYLAQNKMWHVKIPNDVILKGKVGEHKRFRKFGSFLISFKPQKQLFKTYNTNRFDP